MKARLRALTDSAFNATNKYLFTPARYVAVTMHSHYRHRKPLQYLFIIGIYNLIQ